MTYDSSLNTTAASSVSALFDSQADAQRAVDRLVDAGIPADRIRQVAGEDSKTTRTTGEHDEKGFWDSLSDFFFPDEDRYAYAEGLSRGGYLVTVTDVVADQYDTALDILDDEGSVNLDERSESWRAEGWSGYEDSAYAADPSGRMAAYDPAIEGTADRDVTARTDLDTDLGDEEKIPVIQESLRIGKRETGHGRTRVRAYTVSEPVSESVDLREERVDVERRPVDRVLTDADAAFQDRTIEAEEYREEAVVQKEARVVEEIGLRKTSETRRENIEDSVRHTEVEIERDADDTLRSTDREPGKL